MQRGRRYPGVANEVGQTVDVIGVGELLHTRMLVLSKAKPKELEWVRRRRRGGENVKRWMGRMRVRIGKLELSGRGGRKGEER